MTDSRQVRRHQERQAVKGIKFMPNLLDKKLDKVHYEKEDKERLVSCALFVNDTLHHGFKSHSALRSSLGLNPYEELGTEGFYTSRERYITREMACTIGVKSGQLSLLWTGCPRKLLSSDIW